MNATLRAACVAAAAGAFGLAMASGRDCSHIDEHRYTEVSRVMAEPGGDWVVPHLNGAVYSDKPPVFFWAAASAQRLGVGLPLAAFLPSAFGAAAAVLAVFGIGARLVSPAAGLAAAVVLATSSLFASMAGRANLDAFLTGWVALAVYFGVRGDERAQQGLRAALPWYALGCLAAGLGVLVKGPVALAIPALALGLGRCLEGRARSLASSWVAGALALALLPAGLWLLAAGARAGPDYLRTIVLHHGVGHPLGEVDHLSPWSTYLDVLPRAFLPWSLLLPAALVAVWPRRWPLRRAEALALAWFVGGFVLLSGVPAKRQHYLLPIFPGGALLVALLFEDLRRGEAAARGAPRRRRLLAEVPCLAIAAAGVAVGALAVLAAAAVLAGLDPVRALPEWAPGRAVWTGIWGSLLAARAYFGLLMAGLGGAVLGGGLAAWGGATVRRRGVGLAVLAVAAAVLRARVLEVALEPGGGTRAFLERVAPIVGAAPLGDYGGIDFAANWVLARDVVPVLGNAHAASHFLAEHRDGAYLMVERARLEQRGMPEGARVLLVWPRVLGSDLLLLGRDAGSR